MINNSTYILREVTALDDRDAILVFDREKNNFNYPLHFHPEYELNFIYNASGATRLVGEVIEPITDFELCLVAPNIYHFWSEGNCDMNAPGLREVTAQFLPSLFPEELLNKDIFKPIADLFARCESAVVFSRETAIEVEPVITSMTHQRGFNSYINFLQLMYKLAVSPNQRALSSVPVNEDKNKEDLRVEKVYQFLNSNYLERITLDDLADHLNISPITVSRLLKKRTGKTFVDLLNEIRVGHASRKIIESDTPIAQVCYACGFNNLSNFNRVFKRVQGMTPRDFREEYFGHKRVF